MVNFYDASGDVKLYKSGVLGSSNSTVTDNCNEESTFFIQVACLVPENRVYARKLMGLLISCLGVLIYCFALTYFDYIRSIEKNKYLDFDVMTITAGDYTIEFDMPHHSFDYFKKVYLNDKSPMSEIAQFRLYVQEELEQRISSLPDLGFDDEPQVNEQSMATKMNKFLMRKQK